MWLLKIIGWRYTCWSIETASHSRQTRGTESSYGLYQRDLAAFPGEEHNFMAPTRPSRHWDECSTSIDISAAYRRCIAFEQIGQLVSCVYTVAWRGLMMSVDSWTVKLSFLGTWTCHFLWVSTAALYYGESCKHNQLFLLFWSLQLS